MRFCREARPDSMVMERLGIAKWSANKRMTASLALPSTFGSHGRDPAAIRLRIEFVLPRVRFDFDGQQHQYTPINPLTYFLFNSGGKQVRTD